MNRILFLDGMNAQSYLLYSTKQQNHLKDGMNAYFLLYKKKISIKKNAFNFIYSILGHSTRAHCIPYFIFTFHFRKNERFISLQILSSRRKKRIILLFLLLEYKKSQKPNHKLIIKCLDTYGMNSFICSMYQC